MFHGSIFRFNFFFSSRRRHTRSLCDWSSDVCSSDLVNLRTENYSDFGRANTHFLGYGYDVTQAWRLTASTSTAFRAPSFIDLFGFGGNAALRPERARTRELGVQWADGPNLVRVVAFDTRYEDAITFDVQSNTVRNVRKASVNGVESSYSGQLAGFELRAALARASSSASHSRPVAAIARGPWRCIWSCCRVTRLEFRTARSSPNRSQNACHAVSAASGRAAMMTSGSAATTASGSIIGAMRGKSAKTLRPPQSAIASEMKCPPFTVMSGRSEI